MEVHFSPEQEVQLASDDLAFQAAVGKGLDEADRGELIGEDEMDRRLQELLRK